VEFAMPLDSSTLAAASFNSIVHNADHYRQQAERAWRLSICITDPAARNALASLAKDYDEIVQDLESGAIEVRHSELMPQKKS
jgi:hypothetical protein